ncbi:DUF2071 domain-containing protein [Sphingomonas sp. PL-96]|uniref:DUF2071 domain-containing protein n=1 Tax=Sphingomonas sp. PL-96 TaxID=2887201 RepID=UPI001E2B6596|nr:DUF2071 domain-containing protein [Sphingomonas sp. PL-96]MCC2975122.1 DUF2071 domain-containing protein [Sphingomonas sp. PL-96]
MLNLYKSPNQGWRGKLEERVANSVVLRRLRRRILSHLPFMTLTSDVRDVLYASWTVPVRQVQPLVPEGIKLFERGGATVLTILTYRHGHFGPSLLGPVRAVFPSPLQSNWRLYVGELHGQASPSLVLFIRNIFNSIGYAIATRVFSDVLPSHASAAFQHECSASGCHSRIVDAGNSLSIDLLAQEAERADLPSEFAAFFTCWDEAIRFLTLQEAAVADVPDERGLAYSKIDLPIEIGSVQPMLATTFEAGEWLRSLGVEGAPFCFRVPRVRFRALSDALMD